WRWSREGTRARSACSGRRRSPSGIRSLSQCRWWRVRHCSLSRCWPPDCPEKPVHHTVEVHSLSFSYPNGVEALREVTFSIGPDEKAALIGPNGAGKSTLMLHLNGLLMPASGEVHVGGLPVVQENLGQIRAWAGLVFQNPDDQLFNPHVFDDVAFGPLH